MRGKGRKGRERQTDFWYTTRSGGEEMEKRKSEKTGGETSCWEGTGRLGFEEGKKESQHGGRICNAWFLFVRGGRYFSRKKNLKKREVQQLKILGGGETE